MKRNLVSTLALAAAYIGTILAANFAINRWGVVPVGLGLMAPAGVYFAGLAFTLRDLLHERIGVTGTLAAVAAGSAVSAWVSPALAVASATAFGVSELADLVVYSRLRRRGWLRSVFASNVVGLVVDSWLFLTLAFGSTAFLPGQVVGKAWVTGLAIGVLAALRRRGR